MIFIFLLGYAVVLGALGFGALYGLFRLSVFLPLLACFAEVPFIPLSFWQNIPYQGLVAATLLALAGTRFLSSVPPRPHRLKVPLAFLSLLAAYCLGALYWHNAGSDQQPDADFSVPLFFCALSNILVHLLWLGWSDPPPRS